MVWHINSARPASSAGLSAKIMNDIYPNIFYSLIIIEIIHAN